MKLLERVLKAKGSSILLKIFYRYPPDGSLSAASSELKKSQKIRHVIAESIFTTTFVCAACQDTFVSAKSQFSLVTMPKRDRLLRNISSWRLIASYVVIIFNEIRFGGPFSCTEFDDKHNVASIALL